MILYVLLITSIFLLAYFLYGKFLEKIFQITPDQEVPSRNNYDAIDFVPTNKFVLLGHHFSSIAGAGPIVGPIIAGVSFGWLGAILWIVLGTVFVGGLHDFASLILSVNNKGKSVAEIVNKYVNKRTYKLFLVFIWLALVYVITVFTDLAGETFSKEPSVAQVSILYIVVAVIFGFLVYKFKFKLFSTTIFALIIIILGIYFNLKYEFIFFDKNFWIKLLLVYCFFASILPVWLLLQPRDYMSSFILYFSVIIGFIGTIFGRNSISYPAIKSFTSQSIGPLVPFMFITIACGAVSGFHSLVSSGTTSKQLDNTKNAKFVGYGGMILEGIVATIALSTVMILSKESKLVSKPPVEIYAHGIAKFVSLLGFSAEVGKILGYLVISAFILTTLDTATRITRYIFQEFIELKDNTNLSRIISTLASLVLPIILLNTKVYDANGTMVPCWKIVWPLFGATNQLLAALVLIVIYLWNSKQNNSKNNLVIISPTVFMLTMTFWALGHIIVKNFINNGFNIVTIIGSILFLLAATVVIETLKVFRKNLINNNEI